MNVRVASLGLALCACSGAGDTARREDAVRDTGPMVVVNMIPTMFGDESIWNPEPTLAVNPVDRGVMAASAFILGTDVCHNADVSPILVSRDTGSTWSLVCKLPSPGLAGLAPPDVVLRWGSNGQRLYAAFIWGSRAHPGALNVYATDDVFSPDPMQLLTQHDVVDQPDLLVLPYRGHDRVIIAASFKDSMPRTAALLWADDPQPGMAFARVQLERREIGGQNYAVRVAGHASGRVYALFNGVPAVLDSSPTDFLDIAVVRDDSAGSSTPPYAALREMRTAASSSLCPIGDQRVGVRVARCRPFPDNAYGAGFGYQRRLPVLLSIATDPTDTSGRRVYVAWCDSSTSNRLTLTLAKSSDAGQSWRTLQTIPDATNPSVAVDSIGRVGLLFQQLGGDSVQARWITRLLVSRDDMRHARSWVLADTPALVSLLRQQPYIGDWIELHARGREFLGVFSAANMPDTAHFPNGITFQRAVFADRPLLRVRTPVDTGVVANQVPPSIDPFFFRVGTVEAASCAALRKRTTAPVPDPGTQPERVQDPVRRQMARIGCL